MKSENVRNLVLPENPALDLSERIDSLLEKARGQIGLIADLTLGKKEVAITGSHLVNVMDLVGNFLEQAQTAADELYQVSRTNTE